MQKKTKNDSSNEIMMRERGGGGIKVKRNVLFKYETVRKEYFSWLQIGLTSQISTIMKHHVYLPIYFLSVMYLPNSSAGALYST